jgi:hypothetical protein
VAAQKRAAETRLARRTGQTAGVSESEPPLMNALLLAAVVSFGAALCLAVAHMPARAVPWESASGELAGWRQGLAWLGGLGFAATGLFFLFALVFA